MKYKLTSNAKQDLINIRQFTVKNWGVEQSRKYLSELKELLALLATNQRIGKLRSDIAPNAYSFPYMSHVIYYLIDNDQLIVFAVLHKNMLPITHLTSQHLQ
ncbi:plasmid stabilization protein [Pasteurellaceae bacterium LFhippo2]|nr:plasmid stabilization protein [Pasteurellaceae bacterium LFhippo2]